MKDSGTSPPVEENTHSGHRLDVEHNDHGSKRMDHVARIDIVHCELAGLVAMAWQHVVVEG